MPGILLAGYLGSGNLGDDAIMASFVDAIAHDGIECTALSGNPEETYRLHRIPGVPRRDMGAVEKAIASHDALVFPGGSVFQDSTSVKSVAYYARLVEMAKKAKKRVYLVGQGVGPVKSFFGKKWTASAFKAADEVSVRDAQALEVLRSLGIKSPVRVTADTAFLMPKPQHAEGVESFGVGGMKTLAILPRPVKNVDVAGITAELCARAHREGYMPVLIPMDRNEDVPLIQKIADRQGGKIPDLRKVVSPFEVMNRLDRMDLCVSFRLHGGILATAAGVPPLMVSYDPKVSAFARQLGIGNALELEGLTGQRLGDAFVAFAKDRDRNVRLVEKKREELCKLAQVNVQIVRDGLKGRSTI
ncbi:polysaccharide pyruvyl transferase CsaB [soil metagenome]